MYLTKKSLFSPGQNIKQVNCQNDQTGSMNKRFKGRAPRWLQDFQL